LRTFDCGDEAISSAQQNKFFSHVDLRSRRSIRKVKDHFKEHSNAKDHAVFMVR
jgi:hypothetical protein